MSVPSWVTTAWTVEDLCDIFHRSAEEVEMLMESFVIQGSATRITCGTKSVYIPARMKVTRPEGGTP